MIALTCCENMPVAMDDVIIPKTAVVATITTNSRKFILSISYYHICNILLKTIILGWTRYEVL
jgi:hypothetical protein